MYTRLNKDQCDGILEANRAEAFADLGESMSRERELGLGAPVRMGAAEEGLSVRSGARSAGDGVVKASEPFLDAKGFWGVPSWRTWSCALGGRVPIPGVPTAAPVAGDRRAVYVGAAGCGESRNSRGRPTPCANRGEFQYE